MMAWKVESADQLARLGFGATFPHVLLDVVEGRFMLARPLGGLLQSLIPFWSTKTGKMAAGMEVSQSLKSSAQDCSPVMLLTMASGEHPRTRHVVFEGMSTAAVCAFDTISSAIGPGLAQRAKVQPFARDPAHLGGEPLEQGWSAPVERMKMMGTHCWSGNTSSRVHGSLGESLAEPSLAAASADATALSSLKTFTTASR